MRSFRFQLIATFLALTLAGAASAQEESPLKGIISGSFANAYEFSDLDEGGDLDDSVGVDVAVGFQAGEYLAFQLGYEWQTDSGFDTHYFPAIVRGYSPVLLDRLRLYGTVGLGLLFTRPHDEFSGNGNERAGAFHVGGGLSVDITKDLGLLVYLKYKRGMGEVDDWESLVQGVGLEYRWDL